MVGDGNTTIAVNGTGFSNGHSVVYYNTTALSTTFVSATQLNAVIPASLLTSGGAKAISVRNYEGDAVYAANSPNSQFFTVMNASGNPVPNLFSISSTTKNAGDAGFTLTLTGSDFVGDATVEFNGVARTPLSNNSTTITVAVSSADLAAGIVYAIAVVNPPLSGDGGGVSASFNLTVNNPAPTLTSITPGGGLAGSPDFTTTATGTNFVAGVSKVRWNGADLATTFVNSTTLTAVIPAANLATIVDPPLVTVYNPAPSGGTSVAKTFTIFKQAEITNSAVSEQFDNYAPVGGGLLSLKAPDNWLLTGEGGSTGNTGGSFQGAGPPPSATTTGGWYGGSSTLAFLGSGNATNGTATWIIHNNSGQNLTGFKLTYDAYMFRSGSMVAAVSYNVSPTYPAGTFTNFSGAGAGFTSATSGIDSNGVTLTTNTENVSIPAGSYVFVKFSFNGGGGTGGFGFGKLVFSPTGLPSGYYRTVQSGNWSTGSTWEYSPNDNTYTTPGSGPGSDALSIQINSGHNVTLTASAAVTGNLNVATGAQLLFKNFFLSSTGNINVETGTTLESANSGGFAATGTVGSIRLSGTRKIAGKGVNFLFDGTTAQATGTGMPDTASTITISNSLGVTLSKALAITDSVKLTSGTFNLNSLVLKLISTGTKTAAIGRVLGTGAFSNAGNFTMQRWLEPTMRQYTGANVFVGPAVSGKTASAWQSALNPYSEFTYTPYPQRYSSVVLYDPTNNTSASQNGWVKPSSASQAIDPGKGAMVFFYNNLFAAGGVYSLSGAPVTGNKSLPVSFCASGCPSPSAGGTNGFNLVANPYAANINWDATGSAWTKTNINGAVYIWSHKLKAYSSYVTGSGGVNGGSNLITSSQAFFVEANAASPVLTITEAAKTTAAASIMRTAASNRLVFSMVNAEGSADEALVIFNNNTTRAFESMYDAHKLSGSDMNLSTSPAGVKLAINSMAVPASGDILAVNASAVTLGTYSLSFNELPENVTVYLRDAFNNSLHTVTPGYSYSFAITSDANSQGGNRFSLVFMPADVTGLQTTVNDKPVVYPNPARQAVHISIPNAKGKVTARLFSTIGAEVTSVTGDAVNATLNIEGLSSGVYMLKISNATGSWTERLVIE